MTGQSVEYIDEEVTYRAAGISITECVFLRIPDYSVQLGLTGYTSA
jgi:hypothetical protein